MQRFFLPLAAVATVACASRATRAPAPEQPAQTGSAAVFKWSGSFQPPRRPTSGQEQGAQVRASGTAQLTPSSEPKRTRVRITVSAQLDNGVALPWGVYPGRCGSGSGLTLPLVVAQSLPSLDTQNGTAELDSEIALAMPGTGAFHLNVFWPRRANELAGVLACADLKAEGR